ncbi:MAG: bifunctional phosphopantothenoylcysteine decarboxylase/phosphopantothenate--cysteine ligase CoaBC [Saprospiraceae bacterium]|nr:bifunctional phosphopantothenoylcysteine decarboxylase/phosphopantothenate--cysteine ligase CoaBC [Saprospiraceae bacterium]
MLKGKKIILGITGGIAAYKSAFLCRLLVKEGAEVRVIMTPNATKFITPLTLSTLSRNTVYTEVIDEDQWNSHVELGLWGDVMLVAPATATTIAKLAHGIADNMLTLTYLSLRCPVIIAPAMDLDMYQHPSVKDNLNLLEQRGNSMIAPESGELASGLTGLGRMAEPESIVAYLHHFFQNSYDLHGKKIVITAGPTYEDIDPVRFIGNRSSGKMGIAIADECASRGGDVSLIIGPTTQAVDNRSYHIQHVTNAQSMYEAVSAVFNTADIIIFAAAVADYTPQVKSKTKIKKSESTLEIVLSKTIDIAGTLGKQKSKHQVMIGFALETNDEEKYAKEKLHKKNFDFIVLNSLQDSGAGFQHDTNKITIMDRDGEKTSFGLKSKVSVASDIIDYLSKYLDKHA